MERMQKNNKKKIRKYLLYMWENQSQWFKLADRTPLEQGILISLPKIRLKSAPTAVLQLQYKSRWDGSRLLLKNVGNRRGKLHEKIGSR
jgi:hypothetical protein